MRYISTPLRPTPLTVRAAPIWHGRDLTLDDYVHQIDPGQASKVAASVRAAAVALVGRDLRRDRAVGAAQVPLPELNAVLATMAGQVSRSPGFAVLRGLPVDELDERECVLLLRGVCARLGRIATQSRLGDLVRDVRAAGRSLGDGQVRGHETAERLWFHTDGGDAAVLLCRRAATAGGLSRLASAAAVHNLMVDADAEAAAALYGPFHFHMAGGNAPHCPPTFISPIFCLHQSRFSCRFVRHTLLETAKVTGIPLPQQAVDAFDLLEALADRAATDMRLRAGDLQVVNNHTVLHSRTAYTDPADPGRARHLLRSWITLTDLPDLRPSPIDRGLRGGWLSDELQVQAAVTWTPPNRRLRLPVDSHQGPAS